MEKLNNFDYLPNPLLYSTMFTKFGSSFKSKSKKINLKEMEGLPEISRTRWFKIKSFFNLQVGFPVLHLNPSLMLLLHATTETAGSLAPLVECLGK